MDDPRHTAAVVAALDDLAEVTGRLRHLLAPTSIDTATDPQPSTLADTGYLGLCFDDGASTVTRADVTVTLDPCHWRVLRALAWGKGDRVSLSAVFEDAEPGTLRVYVTRLRARIKKLGICIPPAERGIGYQLVERGTPS